jgi:hypothetical protein
VQAWPARWAEYGPEAGPNRNLQLLSLGPVALLALPGKRGAEHRPGSGTGHIVHHARADAQVLVRSPADGLVCDPFVGSGTMAVACALLGREFYGAEIDPQYWPVIRGRLAAVGVVLP